MGNKFGRRVQSFGGGHEIYRSVGENVAFGATVDRIPAVLPYVIHGGTPMMFVGDGTAKILNFYRVIEDVAVDAVIVKVLKSDAIAAPVVGWPIMAAPTTLAGTGLAVNIVSFVDNDTYYTLTLSATLGALSENDMLCDAAAAGADEAAYCVPSTLTRRDVFLQDGDYAATITGVAIATVFANRIPFYPVLMEDVKGCKSIIFEKNV